MLYSKIKKVLFFLMLFSFFLPEAHAEGQWKKIKGNAIDVAIDGKGNAFVVSNKKRQVYRWDIYKQNWIALVKAPKDISKIAASQNNVLYGIVQGKVYKYQSKKWQKVGDFNGFDIGVSSKGFVWAIDRRSKIARWDASRKKWLILKTSGTSVAGKKPISIDVDKNNNPIIVFNDNSVFHYNVSSKNWKKLSNTKLIEIACSDNGKFYGVGAGGDIFKWNRSKQKWDKQPKLTKLNSTFKRLSLMPNEDAWVVLNNGDIHYRTNRVMTDFRPSKHGFRFANSFEANEEIKFDVGIFESFVPKDYYTYNINASYGLCGGMALGAHEYFVQKRKIPATDKTPKKGDRLFDFLMDRQYASLGEPTFNYLTKALRWWGSIEYKETLLEEDTKEEMPTTTSRLDKNDPVQLILIYQTKTTGSPWDNHQVLAYGYEKDYSSLRIFVYDPNCPKCDNLVITYAKKSNGKYYLYQNGYGKPKQIFGMFPVFPKINRPK